MDISINGKPADIVPENEKTLGEILSGLEQWLKGSGHRLSGLTINGEKIDSPGMAGAFDRELKNISCLDISTSSWPELGAEALIAARNTLEDWENASFDDKKRISEEWPGAAAARFISGEMIDLFPLLERALAGEFPGPPELLRIIDERLREIADPRGEFFLAEKTIFSAAHRLEELPLDVQTGKDGRAAETIQLFSNIAEKIFRLLYLLKFEGFSTENITVDQVSAADFFDEFNTALKELLAAYNAKDSVLVGDLAEYELAPRLRKLYGTLKDSLSIAA
ncbi:hypothetical protein AGMMS49928_21560 [Spirochaetia bacterium]|nr:hypothetical protein AGMMS49928_21560 [Spirochaetia bacterium]